MTGGEDHNKSTTFGNWCKKGEVDLSYGVGAADGQPYPWSWEKCTCDNAVNPSHLLRFW